MAAYYLFYIVRGEIGHGYRRLFIANENILNGTELRIP